MATSCTRRPLLCRPAHAPGVSSWTRTWTPKSDASCLTVAPLAPMTRPTQPAICRRNDQVMEEPKKEPTHLLAQRSAAPLKPLTLRDCVILPPAVGAVAVRVAALGVPADRTTGADGAAAAATFAGGAAGDGDLAAEAAAALAEPAATTAAAVAGAGAGEGAGDATAGAGAGVAIAAATAGLAGAVAAGADACA